MTQNVATETIGDELSGSHIELGPVIRSGIGHKLLSGGRREYVRAADVAAPTSTPAPSAICSSSQTSCRLPSFATPGWVREPIKR